MPRSFRFDPPEPRPGTVTRPRLLRAVLERWDHRVTAVVGGPGLGKTTLLAQAIAENRLAPRGEDVWIGIEPADADGDALARDVAAALVNERRRPPGPGVTARADVIGARGAGGLGGASGIGPPARSARSALDPAAVADAVWRRAPTPICLVLDDVHLLPAGSAGAAWLVRLAEELPANGHLVLAGRTALPVPPARLSRHGAVVEISEDDLRFTTGELTEFAASRGVDADRLAGTAGWPAMAELAASVEPRRAGDYLWEEVLDPLGPERRHVLAVVSDLEGADDALATAAVGRPVALAEALAGVPLVARGMGGWRVPHPLWRSAVRLALDPGERAAVRRRAAAHLVERSRFDDAFTLASEVDEWDAAADVLRAACLSGERPTSARLDRWLGALPAARRATPAARLARGLRAAVASPAQAPDPLRQAAQACRHVGDTQGELVALALLGRVGWWLQDDSLVAEVVPRVLELEVDGHRLARALAALARAVAADIAGDDEAVLAELARIEPGVLDPSWRAVADWLQAAVLIGTGQAARALAVLDGIGSVADVAFQRTIESLALVAWWSLGRVDGVVGALSPLLDGTRAAGQAQNIMLGLANASLVLSVVGDIDLARRHLDDAATIEAHAGAPSVPLALAGAALAVAEGDESTAARVLRDAGATTGLGHGSDRRAWRQALTLSYVLVPESRPHWDRMRLQGHLATARSLAAAVVELREGARPQHLRRFELPSTGVTRALLHHRFATELAVGLHAAGRPEGAALLDALGPPGRSVARALATPSTRRSRSARSLLAAVPAPPSSILELAVLGPLVVRRGGAEVTGADLRRERVRELLAYLVLHRKTMRRAIIGALWPDFDAQPGANNLRVTLTYLLRVLEPDRAAGEPPYTVRLDGAEVRLVTGDALLIDVDKFDEHLAAAARADEDASPSLALDHLLAALDLYRGDLHADLPEAEWLAFERDLYRQRFVAAAIRAGQLLVGRGGQAALDRAAAVARAALGADPWAEGAHAVLVAAALARPDRAGARRALDRCESALAELGVDPSDEIRRLALQVRSGGQRPGAEGPGEAQADQARKPSQGTAG